LKTGGKKSNLPRWWVGARGGENLRSYAKDSLGNRIWKKPTRKTPSGRKVGKREPPFSKKFGKDKKSCSAASAGKGDQKKGPGVIESVQGRIAGKGGGEGCPELFNKGGPSGN